MDWPYFYHLYMRAHAPSKNWFIIRRPPSPGPRHQVLILTETSPGMWSIGGSPEERGSEAMMSLADDTSKTKLIPKTRTSSFATDTERDPR